jgi:hypothetical protein
MNAPKKILLVERNKIDAEWLLGEVVNCCVNCGSFLKDKTITSSDRVLAQYECRSTLEVSSIDFNKLRKRDIWSIKCR